MRSRPSCPGRGRNGPHRRRLLAPPAHRSSACCASAGRPRSTRSGPRTARSICSGSHRGLLACRLHALRRLPGRRPAPDRRGGDPGAAAATRPAAISIVSALFAALSGLAVWVGSGGHVRDPYLRGGLALATVLAAAAGQETLDSAAYVPWYMLIGTFWLLFWRPRTLSGALAGGPLCPRHRAQHPGRLVLRPVAAAARARDPRRARRRRRSAPSRWGPPCRSRSFSARNRERRFGLRISGRPTCSASSTEASSASGSAAISGRGSAGPS